jgi:hypothetical protein
MTVAARQKADETSLGEIRRCTVVDMPEWGPWLLGCLREKWPTIGDGSLLGKIGAWSASNEFLFIRNDLAVLLAIVMHDNVDGRPYVRAMFAFARDGAKQSSPGEKAIVALPTHAGVGDVDPGESGLLQRAIRYRAIAASDAPERREGNRDLFNDRVEPVAAPGFAVGTSVSGRPPHRSGRAGFPHPAPTSGG